MNIAEMQVYYGSDLKDYGYTEDGEKFIGEVFYVEVENDRGDRWRHNHFFDGVKIEQCEEGVAYLDNRHSARTQCGLLVADIRQRSEINLEHWHEARCRYGSVAYLDYGQAEDLALEKMEG